MLTARHHIRTAENHLEFVYAALERALHSAATTTKDPSWLDRFHQALAENRQASHKLHTLGTEFGLATEPPI